MDGWVVGFILGGVIVAVVVVLLALLIRAARRTAQKAEEITSALVLAGSHSAPLRELDNIPAATARVRKAAAAARSALTDRRPR
jgi:hypothetical protein